MRDDVDDGGSSLISNALERHGGCSWVHMSNVAAFCGSVLAIFVAGCGVPQSAEEFDSREHAISGAEGEALDDVIERVHGEIDKKGLSLRKLTKAELRGWLDDYTQFNFVPGERRRIESGLSSGVLVSPYKLEIDTEDDPRILLSWGGGEDGELGGTMTVVRGDDIELYTAFARESCSVARTCREDYVGSIPAKGLAFPDVEVRIDEAEAPGTCASQSHCDGSTLRIQLRITPSNVDGLADYFGQGFERSLITSRLDAELGSAASAWVRLEKILPGWVGERAGTFPKEGDNDVCHGPARQFFQPTLENGGSDRSTEPVAILLKDFYCPVANDEEPSFGDYLYIPGRHSGRFILKDPASGRAITFSIQSGGFPAYRFWWADEDFSGSPFDRKPKKNFREELTDVWRRCR